MKKALLVLSLFLLLVGMFGCGKQQKVDDTHHKVDASHQTVEDTHQSK